MNNELTRFEQAALAHIRQHTTPQQRAAALSRMEQHLPPAEYTPRSFPAHSSLSDKLEWLCGDGLVMMLAALIVTAFVITLCAMFLLLPVLLLRG